jgi:hypothetical protein
MASGTGASYNMSVTVYQTLPGSTRICIRALIRRSIARSNLVNYITTKSDLAKQTREGGASGRGKSSSRGSPWRTQTVSYSQ